MTELMTEKEVMEWLKIGRATLYRMRKERKLSCVLIRGSVRYRREDVERLIESGVVKAA